MANPIYIYFSDLSEDTQEEIIAMARRDVLAEYEEGDEGGMDYNEYIIEKTDEEIKYIDVVYRS